MLRFSNHEGDHVVGAGVVVVVVVVVVLVVVVVVVVVVSSAFLAGALPKQHFRLPLQRSLLKHGGSKGNAGPMGHSCAEQ